LKNYHKELDKDFEIKNKERKELPQRLSKIKIDHYKELDKDFEESKR